MSELKPEKDHYICEDELGDEYCHSIKCTTCFGTDYNGEPNGYGCDNREKFIEDNEELILDFEEAYFLQTEKLKQVRNQVIDEVLEIMKKQTYFGDEPELYIDLDAVEEIEQLKKGE